MDPSETLLALGALVQQSVRMPWGEGQGDSEGRDCLEEFLLWRGSGHAICAVHLRNNFISDFTEGGFSILAS